MQPSLIRHRCWSTSLPHHHPLYWKPGQPPRVCHATAPQDRADTALRCSDHGDGDAQTPPALRKGWPGGSAPRRLLLVLKSLEAPH